MEALVRHTGVAVPLRQAAVDTDQICAGRYLKRITKTGYDDALFADRRAADPDFVLNRPAYRGGSVLVAGPDFGIGSSREHAVWALRDYGFRVVLAPRFGDIFRVNSGKQGLLAGVVDAGDAELLWEAIEAEPGIVATVDLEATTATVGSLVVRFAIDEHARWRMLNGLDDIDLTLRHADAIAEFERTRPAWKAAVR
jgi:3-isopropylmalate/(R)-2-methylmalate dehydratase small subunit